MCFRSLGLGVRLSQPRRSIWVCIQLSIVCWWKAPNHSRFEKAGVVQRHMFSVWFVWFLHSSCNPVRLLETRVAPVFHNRGEFFHVVLMDRVSWLQYGMWFFDLMVVSCHRMQICWDSAMERVGAAHYLPWQRLSAQKKWGRFDPSFVRFSKTGKLLGIFIGRFIVDLGPRYASIPNVKSWSSFRVAAFMLLRRKK